MSNEAFWAKVHAFVDKLDQLSYYDVLRLPRDADSEAIRASFYKWASQLHPDRFAGEQDRKRKWDLSLLYARMREAYGVLSDPVQRAEYDQGLRAGRLRMAPDGERRGPAQPELPNDERARRFYQMGVERKRAGKLAEAEFQFRMALQVEPRSELIQRELAAIEAQKPKEPAKPAPRPVPKPAPRLKPRDDDPRMPKVTFGKRSSPAPRPGRPAPRRPGRAQSPAPIGRVEKIPPTGPVAPIVGIDFGTTRSSISVAIGDKVYTLPDDRGRTLHPSVVHYPEDGGLSVCGWQARELVARAPRRTVSSPKRLLGKRYSDPAVGGFLHAAAYKTEAGPNDAIIIDMGRGLQAAVPQVCAQIVAHIRDIGEKRAGARIEQAVFSVPVGFGEAEKNAVTTVARIAGLEVAGFIEEPVAAAMAYGFGKDKHEIVAVYDFGGGTFDFTVIDMAGYHFDVLARGGDTWLGGDDFDSAIAGTIANALWRATGVELQNRQVEWQRLLFACEKAKRELSLRRETEVVVDELTSGPKQINLRQKLNRDQLEAMTRELFDRSIAICKSALNKVGLDPADIHQVVASGGVSYIPYVRAGLGDFFGREITPAVNPDEAICLGAGFRAAQLSRQPVTGVARM